MATWYKASDMYNPKIDVVEVERTTEKSVYIKGRFKVYRENKIGAYATYHPTWAEALAWLMQIGESKVNAARRSLEHAQGWLGNAKGMKPPPEQPCQN